MGVIEELVQRNGLRIALHGRDPQTLQPLVAFLIKQITLPPFATVLIGLANLVLDMVSALLTTTLPDRRLRLAAVVVGYGWVTAGDRKGALWTVRAAVSQLPKWPCPHPPPRNLSK